MSRSTNPRSQQNSLRLITKPYTKNGYPRSFIKSTIKDTLRKCKSQPSEQEQGLMYIKMPFINEDLKRQTQAVLKRTGLDDIKVHYMNGSSSSRIFTPPKEKQCCPDPCGTCGSSPRTDQCLTKNYVYKIKCSHCDKVYIGEISRTIGSRIKEHIRMVKQTVYSRLINHNKDISWEILDRSIHDFRRRKIIEALEIREHLNVTNNCIGRTLNLD